MKCPNCGNDVPENANFCPNCNFPVTSNPSMIVESVQENVNETKNNEFKKYLTIFIILLVIFLILVTIIIVMKINKPNNVGSTSTKTTTTTQATEVEISKNKGTYSGLESPVSFGAITIATYDDTAHNKQKEVDVELVRVLDQTEIDGLVATGDQPLNEGFMWVGVEYRTTLNDFDYLGEDSVSPILNVTLYEGRYHNEFFLVNENYYTIKPIVDSNTLPIKNGESGNVRMVYQVPIDQDYYLCFGVTTKTKGCFKKF